MKKPLAAALIAASSLALVASPAGAAVPKRPATFTVPCRNEPGKAAQVWQKPGQLAANNPCSNWLGLPNGALQYQVGAPSYEYILAPGAHFNWGKSRAVWVYDVSIWTGPLCGEDQTIHSLIYSYKDVRPMPTSCP